MTPSDLAFAQSCVRALHMIAAAAKDWLRAKAIEMAPKKEDTEHNSHQQPRI